MPFSDLNYSQNSKNPDNVDFEQPFSDLNYGPRSAKADNESSWKDQSQILLSNKKIYEISLKKRNIIQTLEYHKVEQIYFDISLDQKYLYVAEQNSVAKIHKYLKYNMKKLGSYPLDSDCVSTIICSHANKMVYIGDLDGRQTTFDTEENKVHAESFVSFKIQALEKSNKKNLLYIAGSEGHLAVFSEKRFIVLKTFDRFGMEDIVSMVITSDDNHMYLGDIWCNLKLISALSFTVIKSYVSHHEDAINSIVLTPDNKYLFTSSIDGTMKKIDTKSRNVEKDFKKVHGHEILSICLSKSGKLLYSSDRKGIIKIWDVEDCSLVKEVTDFGGKMIRKIVTYM